MKDFIASLNWKNPIKAIGNVFLLFGLGLLFVAIIPKLEKKLQQNQKVKRKLKYFELEIHEGFLSKKIVWKQRKEPLTDKQLNNLLNHGKN